MIPNITCATPRQPSQQKIGPRMCSSVAQLFPIPPVDYWVLEWTVSTANAALLPWQTTQDSPKFGSVLITAWPAVFLSS
jgi:hypothetical protein